MMLRRVGALASGLAVAGCSVFGIRTAEEPPFQTVGRVGEVELRSYAPRLAAEVVVPGGEVSARGVGFSALAGYIFRGNRGRETIAMTAPVAQSGAQSGAHSPETIAMTAPVDQAAGPDGTWRIRFFMPAGRTRESLPEPNDSAVRLVEVPAQTVAVLRYTGVASPEAVRDADARLLAGLAGSGWRAVGAPFQWFYDPPWTLPPLRRNEAVVAVER